MIYDEPILEPFHNHHPKEFELPQEIKDLAEIKNTIQKLYLLKSEIELLASMENEIKLSSELNKDEITEVIALLKEIKESNAIEIIEKNKYTDLDLKAIKAVYGGLNSIRALYTEVSDGKFKPIVAIVKLWEKFDLLAEIHDNLVYIVELAKITYKLDWLYENRGLYQDTYAMKPDIEELLQYRSELTGLTTQLNKLIKLTDKVEVLEKVIALESKIDEVLNANYATKKDLEDHYTKSTADAKLLQKVDRTELEANYTNNTALKTQLAKKVEYTELNSAINARKQEQAELQAAVLETSQQLSSQITSISTEVENTSKQFTQKMAEVVQSVNSTSQNMTNQLTSLTTNITAVKNELVAKDSSIEARVAEIESYIPNDTSEDNELANKNYVIDIVQNNAARGITSDATGNSFASLTALQNGPWYYQGDTIDSPHTNDYAIVTADTLNEGNDTRYNYDGKGWIKFQVYRSGQGFTPTTAQLTSINSGITAAKTALIDTNKTNLDQEITDRKSDIVTLKALIANENSDRTQAINNISVSLAAEQKVRLDTDNSIKQSVTAEATARNDADNEIKASVQNNKAEVEAIIGSLESLTTDVKTSIVECLNDLHTEMHDERVAKSGDTMTGTLSITSAGSGPLIHIEGGNKGITFNMDADTGYMHLIPVSNNALGFEFSATTFKPRDNIANSALGSSGNVWNDVWLTRINGKDFSNYMDMTETVNLLSNGITPLSNHLGDVDTLETTAKDSVVSAINEIVTEKIIALSNRILVLENKQATQTVKYLFMPTQTLILSSSQDKYIENLSTNISSSEISFEYQESGYSTISIESNGKFKYHYVSGSSNAQYVKIKYTPTNAIIGTVYLNTSVNGGVESNAIAFTTIVS